MSEAFTSKVDAAKRLAELRKEGAESADDAEEGIDFELEVETPAFSILSADRQRKVMVEFRMLDGDRKARTYAFLAGIDFNPSKGIVMDFSADAVKISGRNLAPLFDGLVAQRIAIVREMDELQAEASISEDATVVTKIEIKPAE